MVAYTFFEHLKEIGSVAAFFQRLREPIELLVINPALPPGHLFGTAHLQALSMFEGADVAGCVIERVACSRIKPGHSSSHQFNPKLFFFQVHRIEVGDLELAAGGGLHLPGTLHHGLVVEIKPRNGVSTFWMFGFFLQA